MVVVSCEVVSLPWIGWEISCIWQSQQRAMQTMLVLNLTPGMIYWISRPLGPLGVSIVNWEHVTMVQANTGRSDHILWTSKWSKTVFTLACSAWISCTGHGRMKLVVTSKASSSSPASSENDDSPCSISRNIVRQAIITSKQPVAQTKASALKVCRGLSLWLHAEYLFLQPLRTLFCPHSLN